MATCPFMSGIMFDSSGTFTSMQYIDCIQDLCQLWNSDKSECSLKDTNLMLIHIDTQHFDKSKDAIPKAAILIQEYQGNQDLDGNNLIYGKDFKIDDNDTNIPKMILTIQSQPDFPEISTIMTWQEYLDTLS